MKKYLFIDRDGTLIREPENKQVDYLEQIVLLPKVIPSLYTLVQHSFSLVMVTNQDSLGSEQYRLENFTNVQNFLIRTLVSQGITFEDIRICPHAPQAKCFCRKPRPGLLLDYLHRDDWDRQNSYVIGDRETDLLLAKNMGLKSFKISQENEDSWEEVKNKIILQPRIAVNERKTTETYVKCFLNLDEERPSKIETGLPFFNHLLEQFAKHAGIYLELFVDGDLSVDDHHSVEDSAIVLGQTIRQALGDKIGIARYGFLMPMDDAQANIALDLSGRSYLVFSGSFKRESIQNFATEMVSHFFKSLADSLGANLHINVTGENSHHMIEAIFKGVGRCFRMAIAKISNKLPSTKGII